MKWGMEEGNKQRRLVPFKVNPTTNNAVIGRIVVMLTVLSIS